MSGGPVLLEEWADLLVSAWHASDPTARVVLASVGGVLLGVGLLRMVRPQETVPGSNPGERFRKGKYASR